MSASWHTTEYGTFTIIDRQGLVAKIFGGSIMFIAGCFLYWLGTAVVEYVRFGTFQDILSALPGMAVTLFMAALFGVPGMLMAFMKKKTLCNKTDGIIRQVNSYALVRRVREVKVTDVAMVASKYKTTKRSNFNRSGGGAPVHTVEIVFTDKSRMEVAQMDKWDSAVDLGKQLAGFLAVEFRDETV